MATATLGQTWTAQQDFSAGAFPGLEAIPANGVEDIINGVIDDDGSVFRRGGAAFKSNANVPTAAKALWDGELTPGQQTVILSTSNIYALQADDATIQNIGGGSVFDNAVKPVELGRMLIIPNGSDTSATNNFFTTYGGSLDQVNTLAPPGLVTFTQGSKTVTGTGTTFLTDAKRGGLIIGSSSVFEYRRGVVDSVESNTSLTLVEPWPYGTSVNISGYIFVPAWTLSLPFLRADVRMYAGALADRTVIAQGNSVYFSTFLSDANGVVYPARMLFGVSEADSQKIENVHKLPEGARVTGLAPLRDVMLVFTSAGVWAIYNLALELTDAAGNPQQRLEVVNRDVILWANGGIVTWRNSLVVPALDDLYLMDSVSQPVPITGGARRLYRSYARAGHRLGQAGIHRGHYLLPIINAAGDVIDTLVWRLDVKGSPFSRWAGYGGLNRAYVQRSRRGLSPQLLALSGSSSQRLTDLTGAFEPSSSVKQDADGSAHSLRVITRTFTAGSLPRFWARLRGRFEEDDAGSDNPSWNASVAEGRPGSVFTSLVGSGPKGESVFTWLVSVRSRAVRFRLETVGPASSAVLRSVEVAFRQSGRQ